MIDTNSERQSIASRLVGAIAILFVHFLVLFLVMVQFGKIAPMYTEFFMQQGVALPAPTQVILHLSEFCIAYWFLIVFVAMVADATIVVLLAFVSRKRSRLLSAYSHLLLLAASVLLLYVSAWLAHPVFSLVRPD